MHEKCFSTIVSSRKPFGLTTSVRLNEYGNEDSVYVYAYPKNGFLERINIYNRKEEIDLYKIYVAKAYGERGDFPYLVLGKPFLGEPNTCCSETYLLVGATKNRKEAENIITYIKTKFFRFLVLLVKNTQDATSRVYQFVPMQNFTENSDISWGQPISEIDKQLYKKYNLTQEEMDFIESMIRPMEGK